MARKPSDLVQVKFRIPERLRRLIEAEATKNKRTQAKEMLDRLEASFTNPVLREEVNFQTESIIALAEHMGRPDIAERARSRLEKGDKDNG